MISHFSLWVSGHEVNSRLGGIGLFNEFLRNVDIIRITVCHFYCKYY